MVHIHRNPDQWFEPLKYIPDRFDPEHKYFLTPEGKKRHPMSFGPFLGGKRICLGKTFVETISKITGPSLLYSFELEFTNEDDAVRKPANNVQVDHEPIMWMKVKNPQL